MVFLKRKEKGKLEVMEDQGATAHFRPFVTIEKFCRDRVSLAVGCDRASYVMARFSGQVYDSA